MPKQVIIFFGVRFSVHHLIMLNTGCGTAIYAKFTGVTLKIILIVWLMKKYVVRMVGEHSMKKLLERAIKN